MGAGKGGALNGRMASGHRNARVGDFPYRVLYPIGAVLLTAASHAMPATAQEPPDSVQVQADSLAADSLVQADSLAADSVLQADSLASDSLQADSLPPPPVLPTLGDIAPAGQMSGIWEWDRDGLMSARGQTLWELLSDIPGLLTVRSGDFGGAVAVFPVGFSGGGVRVYLDGVQHLPLEGAVPDLARIPLSGLERVRVVRRPDGLDVHLFRYVHADPQALSLVEAGTGDLDTNLLRATFSFPRILAGKAALAIERLDTQGRGMPGAVTGAWFRYSLHRGDAAGLRFEIRRMGADRDVFTASPGAVARRDWTLQGVWAPSEGILTEAWGTESSVSTGDSTAVFPFLAESRGQYGTRLSARRGPVWGRATARFNNGRGIADRELSAEVSAVSDRWGGVNLRLRRESWDEMTGTGSDLSAWFTPIPHVGLFAERGGGQRSVPYLNPLPPDQPEDSVSMTDEEPDSMEAGPTSRFTHRSGSRLGLRARWREIELSGARVEMEADSIWPTGLLFDRDGLVLSQPHRQGWELTGRLPLRPRGLYAVGEVQLWDAADSVGGLYFPDHVYRGSLSFHRVFRESGNFELWVDLGAQGRSPMKVPLGVPPDPDTTTAVPSASLPAGQAPDDELELVPDVVPFYQNWYFRLQMRFLTLNIFATVENLTLRRNNQDVPGRLLPGTRSFYGVRWTFWN